MAIPHQSRRHWSHVSVHFGIDLLFWFVAFLAATSIRFFPDGMGALKMAMFYFPGVLVGGITLASICYIFGLYSRLGLHRRARVRYLMVFAALLAALFATFSYGSINFSARIGRGVIVIAVPLAAVLIGLHHIWLTERARSSRDRMICLIASPRDELESRLLLSIPQRYSEVVGCVVAPGYKPGGNLPVLGDFNELDRLIATQDIRTVFCSMENRRDSAMAARIRHLRYSGVSLTTLSSLCEEVFQAIPMSLIDDEWLMNACATSSHIYIAKLKRAFDVALSLLFMLLLSPFFLLGIALALISSGRPIFYSQLRSGKFGREIVITKLRTMNTDAEADGAKWAEDNDPRITPVGRWLRRFRIDEIPQLWSVLRGDISFVGPRPERPEFIKQLAEDIPCYEERLLVQPGLTGWAQVNYPYGSTTDDARRKLEFELYYMKNLSLLLDTFILLDTVKIILRGGASRHRGVLLTHFENLLLEHAKDLQLPEHALVPIESGNRLPRAS